MANENVRKAIMPSMRAPTLKERQYDAMHEWFDPNTQILGRANSILDLLPALLRPSADPGEAMAGAMAPVKAGASALSKAIAPKLGRSMETFSNVLPVQEGMRYLEGLGGKGKNSLAALAKKWQPGPALAATEFKPPVPKVPEAIHQQLGLNFDDVPASPMSVLKTIAGGMPEAGKARMLPMASEVPLAKAIAPKVAEATTKVAKKPMSKLAKYGLGAGAIAAGATGLNYLDGDSQPSTAPQPQGAPTGGRPRPQATPPPQGPNFEELIAALEGGRGGSNPLGGSPAPFNIGQVSGTPPMVPSPQGAPPSGKPGMDWKTLLQIVGPLLAGILISRGR